MADGNPLYRLFSMDGSDAGDSEALAECAALTRDRLASLAAEAERLDDESAETIWDALIVIGLLADMLSDSGVSTFKFAPAKKSIVRRHAHRPRRSLASSKRGWAAALLVERLVKEGNKPTWSVGEAEKLGIERSDIYKWLGRLSEFRALRGMINAGHRRDGVAGRCVVKGKIIETEEIPAYCAVAVAGLGHIPETILSRSVVIRMRR